MQKKSLNREREIRKAIRLSLWPLLLLPAMPILVCGQGVPGAALQELQKMQQASGAPAQLAGAQSGHPIAAIDDVTKIRLTPGSSVSLHVFEEPDLDGNYRLDANGFIFLPLAGQIDLRSMTLHEAEVAVGEQLTKTQVLNSPHVVANLDEYSAQYISVIGEVNSPGRQTVMGPRKLIDVIAMSGGQTALAGNEIVVHRLGQAPETTETIHYGKDVNDPVALNSDINPGDTVLVKRAGIVYVLGAVTHPGGYVMQEAGELNVDQAIALASGAAPEAKTADVRVLRRHADGTTSEFVVNYKKVNSGTQQPVQLQAEDIVYVPPSSIKEVLLHGTQILASAAGAVIYTK
jgi:polysaccharide biosynthesis/export protein